MAAPQRIAKAALIFALLMMAGWAAVSTAVTPAIHAGTQLRQDGIFSHGPGPLLAGATAALVERRGILPPTMLAEVRDAAAAAPLDARPYLILGHQALLDRQNARALRMLEAGQRLDPRQRLIHVLLLDRYLREQRFAPAGEQFAVLARLVGEARGPTATLVAQMILQPETRAAAIRTLREDPGLERSVLAALARADAEPAMLFALASPAATASAAYADGWGTALVQRLAERNQLIEAKRVWQRLYAIPGERAALPLYDNGFQGWPGGAPFNWSLTTNAIGAVDRAAEGIAIEYYGRDGGELASQTLTLRPGRYRLTFQAQGNSSSPTPDALSWTLACAGRSGPPLLTLPLTSLGNTARRFSAAFAVPAGCRGQRLVLSGSAAEFPTTARATVSRLAITAADA